MQYIIDKQQEPHGGNGWLRLIEFLPNGTTVQVKTYSPFLDQWLVDPAHQFTIELSVAPEFPTQGDVEQDADVAAAPSGR